jgi:hypothetical protein
MYRLEALPLPVLLTWIVKDIKMQRVLGQELLMETMEAVVGHMVEEVEKVKLK